MCVCVPDVPVRGRLGCEQPNIPQTSTSGTHTHKQHTATYQINNLTTKTNREVVTARSTEDGPLKIVKQVTETYKGFSDVIYKPF